MQLYETWDECWRDVIRKIIFPDSELKELMCVPDGTTIIQFIDKYFVRAGYTSEILTNEDVRIVYSVVHTNDLSIQNAGEYELHFDIYVRQQRLHDVGRDRLAFRTDLIAKRLKELLFIEPQKHSGFVGMFRFYNPKESDLGTRTIGYTRHNLRFNFKRFD